MSVCHFIVCEKTGDWAAGIKPRVSPSLRVVETRSLSGCREALAAAPASLVALHGTEANADRLVEFLVEASERYPRAALAGLLGPDDLALAPLLREAGACEVICSVLDIPRLTRLAARHAARSPQPEWNLHESLLQRMPWSAYAERLS
jgi:hypothetical protein